MLQTRTSDPLIDIGLLRHRPHVVTNVNSLLIGFAMFATFIALPRFVQAPTVTGYGYVATFVFGIGIGLAVAAQGSFTIAVVEQHQTGAAGGANTVVRTVGGALGAPIAANSATSG